MKTILIIEDDINLSRGIAFSFEREGFTVLCAGTLGGGKELFAQHAIDLIILDLNLPDGDGADFCRGIRTQSHIPIIMLTARDLEEDEICGLTAGADDYITKPFSVSVLRARAAAVLRRLEGQQKIESAGFMLDTHLCKLYKDGTEIPISTTEFRLLKLLMGNAGKVLTKEQIFAELWGGQAESEYVDENTLSVNISRLRSKIEDNPKKPAIVKTIHGIGYTWAGA